MKPNRTMLLAASALLMLGLLAGGMTMRVGADDGSYSQTVLFSEVLALILDNYVDPVEAEGLLRGAYEGMLGGLDPNGAYLTPDEVREWKAALPWRHRISRKRFRRRQSRRYGPNSDGRSRCRATSHSALQS